MSVPDQVRDDEGACPALRCGGIQDPIVLFPGFRLVGRNDKSLCDNLKLALLMVEAPVETLKHSFCHESRLF